MRKRFSLLKSIFSLCLKVAFSIAVAELTLYLVHYPSWWGMGDVGPFVELDHDLGWVNKPGEFNGVFDNANIKISTLSNHSRSCGYNSNHSDSAHKIEKNIILIGDSYVYGYGVTDSDTLGWKLQEKLADHAVDRAVVLNYGVPRYGTVQSYLMMKRIIATLDEPTRHASQFIYLLNSFHEERNVGGLSWRSVWKQNEVTFPIARISNSGELEFDLAPASPIPLLARICRTCALVYDVYRANQSKIATTPGREITKRVLLAMNQLAQSAGVDFSVITFDGPKETLADYAGYLKDQHIESIDCSNVGALNGPQYRIPDGHPNGLLYSELAKCIVGSH